MGTLLGSKQILDNRRNSRVLVKAIKETHSPDINKYPAGTAPQQPLLRHVMLQPSSKREFWWCNVAKLLRRIFQPNTHHCLRDFPTAVGAVSKRQNLCRATETVIQNAGLFLSAVICVQEKHGEEPLE